jgi:hypothetical protein
LQRAVTRPFIEQTDSPSVGTVICGGGPAGLGPLVCAARTGRLVELLAGGVHVVEAGDRLGPGSIARYAITGNSMGRAYLECLDADPGLSLLSDLRETPAARALAEMVSDWVPLALVGRFLEEIGRALERRLRETPGCGVVLGGTVRRVWARADGSFLVTYDGTDGHRWDVSTRTVLLTLGGRPPSSLTARTIVGGRDLSTLANRVIHACEIIEERASLPVELTQRLAARPRVIVVGGGHSGWSVAWRLLHSGLVLEPGALEVTILHRHPIRLYYETAEKARGDGYAYDPEVDVCRQSGRINRFGGLRGDAFELARSALGVGGARATAGRIRLLELDGTPAADERARAVMERAGLVVVATGFDPRLPELRSATGAPLALRPSELGLAVNERAELLDARDQPVPGLLAYGLGAGLRVSEAIGGEASFTGRADGVWLYQHDLGRMVLEHMLSRSAERGRTGRVANHAE